MSHADEKKTNDDLFAEVAKAIAAQIPSEVLVRVLSAKLEGAFAALSQTWHKDSLDALVSAAVKERAEELLRTKYAKEIDELGDRLARDALSFSRLDLSVQKKRT